MPGKKTVQAFWQGQEPVNVAPMAFLRSQIREAQASVEATSALKDAAATNEAAAIWGRFRSALSVAGDVLPRADAKRCGNPIRRLQKRLAAARDIEARIETVCDVLAELPDESFPPGITRLMAVLDGDRRAARAKIAKATRRLVKSKALDELRAAAKRASKQFHKDHGGEKLAVVRRRALERVGRQVNRVLACRPSREELAGGKHRHAACAALRRLHDMLEASPGRSCYRRSRRERAARATASRHRKPRREQLCCKRWKSGVGITAGNWLQLGKIWSGGNSGRRCTLP